MANVFLFSYLIAWAESISPDMSAAPPRAQSLRKGASVTPTRGDRITLCGRTSDPRAMGWDKADDVTAVVMRQPNFGWEDSRRQTGILSDLFYGTTYNIRRPRSSLRYRCRNEDREDK